MPEKCIYLFIYFKNVFICFLFFPFKEEQVTNTVNIRNMLPDNNKIKIQIMITLNKLYKMTLNTG